MASPHRYDLRPKQPTVRTRERYAGAPYRKTMKSTTGLGLRTVSSAPAIVINKTETDTSDTTSCDSDLSELTELSDSDPGLTFSVGEPGPEPADVTQRFVTPETSALPILAPGAPRKQVHFDSAMNRAFSPTPATGQHMGSITEQFSLSTIGDEDLAGITFAGGDSTTAHVGSANVAGPSTIAAPANLTGHSGGQNPQGQRLAPFPHQTAQSGEAGVAHHPSVQAAVAGGGYRDRQMSIGRERTPIFDVTGRNIDANLRETANTFTEQLLGRHGTEVLNRDGRKTYRQMKYSLYQGNWFHLGTIRQEDEMVTEEN
ncbi:hypothetical protein K488DRAFT_67099 [Vararia minispora EC-137]|uniref:Uncharacterized protein n=1 Tax=Vararia minispora EC-137 TaxID=1314806 RepID=A0ACB8QZC1_9AGAM|nr:hypothetical protein K488DRAFT_67099 [Vararia minispora EC-137]